MSGEKKNNSLLYQLYQKYKDAKEDSGQEAEASELIQAALDETGLEVALEEAMPVEEQIPESLRYLESLYRVYQKACEARTDLVQVEDIRGFETRLYEPIAGLSIFKHQKDSIKRFVEMIGLHISVEERLGKDELPHWDRTGERAESGGEETPPKEEEPIPPPIDSEVYIKILNNKMSVILFAVCPLNGGEELGIEAIYEALQEEKVVSGLDQDLLMKLAVGNTYMQVFEVAKGTQPIDGIDGRIEDRTDCRSPKTIRQDAFGNADFRNLNLYEDIKAGCVICQLIPPVEGKAGMDVLGNKLSFLPGKLPAFQVGKNTVISEDGLQLLSEVGGHVSYRGGRYEVEPILVISGNVDYSVGNIDFAGDVMISGDVCNGFTVKAEGSITVLGMVEDAQLSAGGDIVIKKGMNGNLNGTINAMGEVRVSFLENCKVFAGGDVHVDTMIGCNIFCDASVFVEGNRGIVIGGSITALRFLEARIIGNKSQRETTIILGDTPHMILRRNSIEAELKETREVLNKLKLNITYLTRQMNTLSSEKLKILTQLTEQNTLYEWRKTELEAKLLKLMEEATDYSRCYVRSNMIFPVTKVTIGSSNTMISRVESRCNIKLSGEEIVVETGG